jgi:hypothetical protein
MTQTTTPPFVTMPLTVVPDAAPRKSAYIVGVHPAATMFPMMNGQELELLVKDMGEHGLLEPIVTYQNQILDGRNRLRACELLEIEPQFIEWDGVGSPIAFVLSRNLHRRHLNESQRAIVAARAKTMFENEALQRERAHQFGSASTNLENDEKSPVSSACANLHTPRGINAQSAALLNVSARSVATASRVLAAGDEQLVAAIDAGQVAVSDAAAILDLPKAEQLVALDKLRSGKARTLRQATKNKATVSVSNPEDPKLMRRAYKLFMAEYGKMMRSIDMAATGSGGANDFTKRARDCLQVAQRAMHDCLQQHGRPKQSPEHAAN